ncbi:hypothetical protein Ptr902_09428 [Pyrenophora tritici-repentis]|nr:hypothetical protein Ptr902_09428 [Pyrenophora tritici-repentis]
MLGLQRALAAVSTRDLNGSRRAGKPAESKASETAMIHLTAATAVCGAAEWPRLGAKGPPCIATQWALWARTKFEIPLTLTPPSPPRSLVMQGNICWSSAIPLNIKAATQPLSTTKSQERPGVHLVQRLYLASSTLPLPVRGPHAVSLL